MEAFSQLASRLATMQVHVGCTFRNLWQAQPPSSEGQWHCHFHQMYLAITIGYVYVCTPVLPCIVHVSLNIIILVNVC